MIDGYVFQISKHWSLRDKSDFSRSYGQDIAKQGLEQISLIL